MTLSFCGRISIWSSFHTVHIHKIGKQLTKIEDNKNKYNKKHNGTSNDRFFIPSFFGGFLPYMFTAVQYSFLSLSIPAMIWYVLLFLLIIQSIPTVEDASVGRLDTMAKKKRQHMIIYVGLLIMFSTDALAITYSPTAKRKRRTVGSMFCELGLYYTRRAYQKNGCKYILEIT